MKKIFYAKLICLLLATPLLAAPVVKEGVSYSVIDANFEQTTLLEVYKTGDISANLGIRSNDTVLADIGYDLGKLVEPIKSFVASNPLLKPFSVALNLFNPSVDIYGGSKILRDNYRINFNDAELDYGIAVVACRLTW